MLSFSGHTVDNNMLTELKLTSQIQVIRHAYKIHARWFNLYVSTEIMFEDKKFIIHFIDFKDLLKFREIIFQYIIS